MRLTFSSRSKSTAISLVFSHSSAPQSPRKALQPFFLFTIHCERAREARHRSLQNACGTSAEHVFYPCSFLCSGYRSWSGLPARGTREIATF